MELHNKLKNRKCETMAHVIEGKKLDGDDVSTIRQGLESSLFLKALSRKQHDLSTDTTAALNEASGLVLEASSGDAIGRQCVQIFETTREAIKVRKTRVGLGVQTARGKKGPSKGLRNEYITLNPNKEIEASDRWDNNYLEDADYDVAASEARSLGIAHDIIETSAILKFLKDIPAAELAGGALVAPVTAGTFTYSDIVNLWNAVKRGNYQPDILVMHPDEFADLMKDSDFKDQTILGQFADISQGLFGRLILGLNIVVSSLMIPGDVFCLDSKSAVLYALRRDQILKTFQPTINEFEMMVSSRYDIEKGRTETFARMAVG